MVTEQIDAGAKLASEFDSKYKPLKAAFWLKESEDGQWFLYLVSDQIDDTNFHLAYGEVPRLLGRGPHLWLDPFQIKVAGIDDPVAKAVLEIQQKYPGRPATRLRNRMVGGLNVEEAFIYAIPIAVPS